MVGSMTTILVTGSTDGIGRETARQLGEAGARVLVHGRTRAKAESAAASLRDETKRDAFEAVAADFASLDEVRALAVEVARRHPRLDVLVNNAGIYARERSLSADGVELTLAVNHFAPFALTHLLLGALPSGGRIVFVSSNVHRSAAASELDDLSRERSWDGYSAYADSKLMNVLTAFELARRLEARAIAVNAMHPGVIGTKLLRRGFGASGGAEVARGAAGEVKLATDPALDGVSGRYFDQTTESHASTVAQDRALQKRVYDLSIEHTGVAAV
jgi:NAD(P)-dependent dehydrogenase (short-subunit alcohol dehydrogenase family)